MISLLDSFADWRAANAWWNLLGDVSLKALVILLVACVAQVVWRGGSAAARHLVWSLVLCGVLALPLLTFALPEWRIAPVWWSAVRNQAAVMEAPKIETPKAVIDRAPETLLTPPLSPLAFESVILPMASASPKIKPVWSWPQALFLIWCGGALLALARMVVGAAQAWWLADSAVAVNDWSWTLVIDEVSEQLHLRRRIAVRISDQVFMPLACGVWRAVILLPAEAEKWTVEWRRIVLLHEMAHARRRDCLTQMLAQLACALYWFNPLVWLAARRLRLAREMACDDEVLSAGTRASDYAGYLVELAKAVKAGGFASPVTVGMGCSQLESRVRAILHPDLKRHRLSRATIAAAVVIVAGVVAPLSALSWKAQAATRTPQKFAALTGASGMTQASEVDAPRQKIASALEGSALLVTPQDGAPQQREAESGAQDARDVQARLEELLRLYEKLRETQLLTPEQAAVQRRLEEINRQYDQSKIPEWIKREYQDKLSRYQELKKETPESEEMRAKIEALLQDLAARQAQGESDAKLREEQLRQLELNLSQQMRQPQIDPETWQRIQQALQEYARQHQIELVIPEQEQVEAVRKALEEHSAAIARYGAGLIDEARLAEMSKVLAERMAALQKDRDSQTSEWAADWAARKAELDAALKQLSESNPDSLELMRQRAEIERLTAAYGQLMLRKVSLEAQIKNLLRQHASDSPEVKRLQTELENIKRELEKLVK